MAPSYWTSLVIRRNCTRAWSVALAAGSCVRDTSQLRFLPDWVKSLVFRESTLSRRVPWMPYSIVAFLEDYLASGAEVFEYGGGGSSLWFAQRASRVFIVDHNREWADCIRAELSRGGFHASPVILCECSREAPSEEYVAAIDAFADGSLDLVVVDGIDRLACLRRAAPKVRPNGLLLLDDSERYPEAAAALPGWTRKDFWGLKPFVVRPNHSTCWVRPVDAKRLDEFGDHIVA